jgi:hypothetical protein
MFVKQLYIHVQINVNLLFVMDVNILLLMSTTSFSINKRATFICKSNVFVRNQVIKYRFKMIRLHDTVIVLEIVITN